jgi:AraC-like DNA-binding protein
MCEEAVLNARDNPGPVPDAVPTSKGHLNPEATPPVLRYAPRSDLRGLVRHFWVPEWDLPHGAAVTARVLGYPALNLVVECRSVTVVGPGTRETQRVLTGSGWAAGALLRPAATAALGYDAASLVDRAVTLEEPSLAAATAAVMAGDEPRESRHCAAVEVVSTWLAERCGDPGEQGMLANRFAELVEEDLTVSRVTDLAARLHVSPRTLQRAVRRCTGFSPADVVRRRRLQDAADLVAHQPAPLSDVAQRAGYADHAHMARAFRSGLRQTPSGFRGRP